MVDQDERLDEYVKLGKAKLVSSLKDLKRHAQRVAGPERADEIVSEFEQVIAARNTAVHGHHSILHEGQIVRFLTPGRGRELHTIPNTTEELDRWAARAAQLAQTVLNLQFAGP